MPHKLLERQYQLQAQKRHKQFVKQDFYRQTAHYFIRESEAAKQFNSWITRGPEAYTDRLEKKQRAEKLLLRQEKLRNLLKEENELFAKELQQKQTKKCTSETLTLDQLRQKLLEKKAEQSLYYPSSCRRVHSYGFSSTDTARKLKLLEIDNSQESAKFVPSIKNSQRYKRHSTESYIERILFPSKYETEVPLINENRKLSQLRINSQRSKKMSGNTHSSNQSTCEHDSLNGINTEAHRTNVKINTAIDGDIHRGGEVSTVGDIHINKNINTYENINTNGDNNVVRNIDTAKNTNDYSNGIERRKDEIDKSVSRTNSMKDKEILSVTASATEVCLDEDKTLQFEDSQSRIDSLSFCLSNASNQRAKSQNFIIDSNRYRKGNMRQQEPDCSGTADISVQMYRYLKHNDLKREIHDLEKRENLCATKHCWDEGLRLREMRNKLILLKNKNLFENHDLRIDENTRNSALSIIEAREKVNKSRARVSDRLLYSDEAKDLWQQWIREDAALEVSENKAVRDLLLPELEEEWKNLAIGDKNRISQLYGHVINKSDLQDEHKLATIIRDANDRQKQYMNYLAT